MTIIINFRKLPSHEVDQVMLEEAIRLTLLNHNETDAELTLQLTDDGTVRRLNQDYRGINETTDVLAFNQDFINPETNQTYLGDIIISLERACLQAVDNNHTLNDETALLTIHGTLHLLGYDHSDEEEKERMWKIQDKILLDLKLSRQEDVE